MGPVRGEVGPAGSGHGHSGLQPVVHLFSFWPHVSTYDGEIHQGNLPANGVARGKYLTSIRLFKTWYHQAFWSPASCNLPLDRLLPVDPLMSGTVDEHVCRDFPLVFSTVIMWQEGQEPRLRPRDWKWLALSPGVFQTQGRKETQPWGPGLPRNHCLFLGLTCLYCT